MKATMVKTATEGVYEVVRLDVNYGSVHVLHKLAQIQIVLRQTLSHVNAEPILVLVVQPCVPALLTRVLRRVSLGRRVIIIRMSALVGIMFVPQRRVSYALPQLARVQMDIRQTLSRVNAELILVLVVQPCVTSLVMEVMEEGVY